MRPNEGDKNSNGEETLRANDHAHPKNKSRNKHGPVTEPNLVSLHQPFLSLLPPEVLKPAKTQAPVGVTSPGGHGFLSRCVLTFPTATDERDLTPTQAS